MRLKPNDLGKCILDSSWDILQQYLSKWMISTPVSQNQLSTMDAPHYVGHRQSVGIISAFAEFFWLSESIKILWKYYHNYKGCSD